MKALLKWKSLSVYLWNCFTQTGILFLKFIFHRNRLVNCIVVYVNFFYFIFCMWVGVTSIVFGTAKYNLTQFNIQWEETKFDNLTTKTWVIVA